MNTTTDLDRFISAQADCYEAVRAELQAGRKTTHWMWFIFPQLDGLGQSAMAKRYSIRSRQEAIDYLSHPVLGGRLLECTGLMLAVKSRSAFEILGTPDDLKFRSSMTLFAEVAGYESVFRKALDRFQDGKRDMRTLELLKITG
jgi:uncharacterized protein (DUF1810 family)